MPLLFAVTWYRLTNVAVILGLSIPKYVLGDAKTGSILDLVNVVFASVALYVIGWWEKDPPSWLEWYFRTDWVSQCEAVKGFGITVAAGLVDCLAHSGVLLGIVVVFAAGGVILLILLFKSQQQDDVKESTSCVPRSLPLLGVRFGVQKDCDAISTKDSTTITPIHPTKTTLNPEISSYPAPSELSDDILTSDDVKASSSGATPTVVTLTASYYNPPSESATKLQMTPCSAYCGHGDTTITTSSTVLPTPKLGVGSKLTACADTTIVLYGDVRQQNSAGHYLTMITALMICLIAMSYFSLTKRFKKRRKSRSFSAVWAIFALLIRIGLGLGA